MDIYTLPSILRIGDYFHTDETLDRNPLVSIPTGRANSGLSDRCEIVLYILAAELDYARSKVAMMISRYVIVVTRSLAVNI